MDPFWFWFIGYFVVFLVVVVVVATLAYKDISWDDPARLYIPMLAISLGLVWPLWLFAIGISYLVELLRN